MHDINEEAPSENLAQTLARELPRAAILGKLPLADLRSVDGISLVAVPQGTKVEQLDFEKLLSNPRRTAATATLSDGESFIDYVKRHANDSTVCWANFNPQTFALGFTAVFDEHAKGLPGWRAHKAAFTPDMSAEWKVWTGNNKQAKAQIEFAEFLERHEPDIATQDGYPTSLQMLQLATEFEANSEKRVKSVIRLQGGGTRLDYVDDEDAGTLLQMKVFERFQIGIPVFWAGPGYRIDARLKYRNNGGKVSFWFDLIRPDRVHEAAAKELIAKVREGIGAVPLLMGACN